MSAGIIGTTEVFGEAWRNIRDLDVVDVDIPAQAQRIRLSPMKSIGVHDHVRRVAVDIDRSSACVIKPITIHSVFDGTTVGNPLPETGARVRSASLRR
jgi:hypothetical protein